MTDDFYSRATAKGEYEWLDANNAVFVYGDGRMRLDRITAGPTIRWDR